MSPPATTFACKAIFALKQVCVDSNRQKLYIASHCGKKLVDDYFDPVLERSTDFYNQATLLMQVLTTHNESCGILYRSGLTHDKLITLLRDPTVKAVSRAKDTQGRIHTLASTMSPMDYVME